MVAAVFDSITLTYILWKKFLSPFVVANRHATAANTADHDTLQKSRPFPRWTLGPLQSIGLRALPESTLIILVILKGYVAFMSPWNQTKPFFSG
jgi:hypothetical protein